MKSTAKREIALAGIILGAAIAGPAAGAAQASRVSSQKITVDGRPVQIEAYSINGSNYAKLRDVGREVGFAVAFDAASNTVQISAGEPYVEDIPEQASRVVRLPTDGSKYARRWAT